jgi:hypothetical protein
MPWGTLSKMWLERGQLEIVEKQRAGQFDFRFAKGKRYRTFAFKNRDVEEFRSFATMNTCNEFSFDSFPDRLLNVDRKQTIFFSNDFLFANLNFVIPDRAIGQIESDLSEDMWDTALAWLLFPHAYELFGGSPNCLHPFGNVAEHADLPIPGSYHWMVYLRPDVVEILGGLDRVVSDGPVERLQVIDTAENEKGVLCSVAESPHRATDDQWREWRNFLSPLLGPVNVHNQPLEIVFPRLTPEDRLLFPNGKHLLEQSDSGAD